jgi:hypothetical protein
MDDAPLAAAQPFETERPDAEPPTKGAPILGIIATAALVLIAVGVLWTAYTYQQVLTLQRCEINASAQPTTGTGSAFQSAVRACAK